VVFCGVVHVGLVFMSGEQPVGFGDELGETEAGELMAAELLGSASFTLVLQPSGEVLQGLAYSTMRFRRGAHGVVEAQHVRIRVPLLCDRAVYGIFSRECRSESVLTVTTPRMGPGGRSLPDSDRIASPASPGRAPWVLSSRRRSWLAKM